MRALRQDVLVLAGWHTPPPLPLLLESLLLRLFQQKSNCESCPVAISPLLNPPLLFRFPISTPRPLRVCATPALTSLVRSKQQLSPRARSKTWPQEEEEEEQQQQQQPLARHLRAQSL